MINCDNAIQASHQIHRDLRSTPTTIIGGHGAWLHGDDGTHYLDAVAGAAVVSIGHGVEEIYQTLADLDPTYVYGEGFTTQWSEQFADELVDFIGSPFTSAYLVSGGSEANETAVKLARQYHVERGEHSRHKIIARWQSYHGVTTGMLSLSGRTSWREPFDPYLFAVPRIPAPYCYRCPFGLTYPRCDTFCASELERTILREGPSTIAAFIAEPIIGTTVTAVAPVAEYYSIIRDICDRYGILFIADEVLTGMGRTGAPLAIQHWGVTPDIVTLGKGIGSGYAALGAVLTVPHILDTLRAGSGRFNHGFTYAGLPSAAVVGSKVLEILRRDELPARSLDRGATLHRHLAEADLPAVGDIRSRGLLLGVELVRDRRTKEPFPEDFRFANRVAERCLQHHGVVVRAGLPGANHGQGGDHLQISPPLVISEHEIVLLATALIESIEEVTREHAQL